MDNLWRAIGYSLSGLRFAFGNERAFRHETLVFMALCPMAFWLGQNWLECAVLLAAVGQVLIVELLNTSIETVVNRISLEPHPLSKQAKDVASAAVFLAVSFCALVWTFALVHKLGSRA